jgi:hypothetical protein
MHEMFHISRIANSPPNLRVYDLWIYLHQRRTWLQAYGAELAKVLARTRINTGAYVMSNAENLMYFAMATYYQSVLNGEYPSRPFAQDVPEGDPTRRRPGSIFEFDSDKLGVQNSTALAMVALSTTPTTSCGVGAQSLQTSLSSTITFDEASATFAADSDYPTDYQSSLASWRSTWAAQSTTAASPNPTTPPSSTQSPSKQPSSLQPSHTITPVCHSTPTDVKSPPQASVAAAIDSFCSNTQVAVGKTISNEQPYVDLPYSIAGSSNLVQLTISFGANGCGGWFTIDGPTCKTMLTTVLDGCSSYRGNVTDVCAVYSVDITDAKTVDPSIPDYAIHRGTYSCVDT